MMKPIEERVVTVEEVTHPYAVVRDQRGGTFQIPTSILPVRGKVPRINEQWTVARHWLSGWRWVGYIDITGQGGSSYVTTVGDGSTTEFTITHGLGTTTVVVQAREEVAGEGIVDTAAAITILSPTQVKVVFTAAPAVDAGTIVVLSA